MERISVSGQLASDSCSSGECRRTTALQPSAADEAAQSAAPVRSSAITTILATVQLQSYLLEDIREYHQAVRKGAAIAVTIILHAE
jgi:hypothetical protein